MASYTGVEADAGTLDRSYSDSLYSYTGVEPSLGLTDRSYADQLFSYTGAEAAIGDLSRSYTDQLFSYVGAEAVYTLGGSDYHLVRHTAYPGVETTYSTLSRSYNDVLFSYVGKEASLDLLDRTYVDQLFSYTGAEASAGLLNRFYNDVLFSYIGVEALSADSSLIYGTSDHVKTAILTGTVYDTDSNPIAGATVSLLNPNNQNVVKSVDTRGTGNYNTAVKENRTRTIEVTETGYTTDSRPEVTFTGADVSGHDYTLETLFTVSGTVQDEGGSGVDSANITASANTVRSNDRVHWYTTSDWDNATSENNVQHANATISLAKDAWTDDFSDGTHDGWTEQSGSWDASNNYLENTSSNNDDEISHSSSAAYGSWEFDHRHDPTFYGAQTYFITPNGFGDHTNNSYYIRFNNSNSNYNRELKKADGGSNTTLLDLGDWDGNWHTYRIERATDDTFEVFVDGTSQGTVQDSTHTSSQDLVLRADNSGHDWDAFTVSEDYLSSGSLTTATKTFDSAEEPDLTNVRYSLNGKSIDVTVIGSPGTASEEQVTQTLDGSQKYDLSWNNSHTDFRLKVSLSTNTDSTTPEFESAELKPIIHHQD